MKKVQMRFIESPNLPHSDVGLAAVSGTYKDITKALRALRIAVVEFRPYGALDTSVSSHADMLCHHLGGKNIVCARGNPEPAVQLAEHGFAVVESNICIHRPYPADVALNALRIGNKLMAKTDVLDEAIKKYCEEHGLQLVKVRQGYAKCSAAVVDSKSILTSDEGIARAAQKNGIDVLKIRPGFIQLDGCDYGFIGGTCGKIGKNSIAFAGKIETHPDGNKIKKFLEHRGIHIVALLESPLIDIGGILPLKERESGT